MFAAAPPQYTACLMCPHQARGSREIQLHQLGLQPELLKVHRHGLADIHDLRQTGVGDEVYSELVAVLVARLRQKLLGLLQVIALVLVPVLVPLRVPNPGPHLLVQHWMETIDGRILHLSTRH